MPLIYSAVARGPAILAEYAVFAGNFSSVTKDYLSKSSHTGSFSYTVDSHVFSFLGESGYTFVVVTDEAAGRTIPTSFLKRVKDEFMERYAEKGRTAKENGLAAFSKKLKETMEHATQFPEEYSKITSVQKKVDEVKQVMSDNIEKVLSRGEKLDTLVDKTDNLMFEADRFQKQGKALRQKMWWNNIKMKVVMVFVVILVIVIIFLLICFSGRNCVSKYTAPKGSPSPATASPAPSPSLVALPSPNTASAAPLASGGARKLLMAKLLTDAMSFA